jgi:hypothetical protein
MENMKVLVLAKAMVTEKNVHMQKEKMATDLVEVLVMEKENHS